MRRMLLIMAAGTLLTAGCTPPSELEPYRPVAGTKLLMNSVLDPAADYIWDSVKTISTLEGIEEYRPETDEEWIAVRNSVFRTTLVPETLSVTVRGPRSTVESLELNHGAVYIDAMERPPGEYELVPEVVLPPNVELVTREPDVVRVYVSMEEKRRTDESG